MYLSEIEILGFKSFAQRVDLKFDSGVTAIVGPNGCGKTNIVDAIRWALGEQRYGALRSEKMEDLIFSGTKNRKPLGMAEVSLTIQNTKGILPTEYSEITITRSVYRSGESEYYLNRVPCRLKDILDLFMDTGIGADAYSVIELKMVETILSDKADERRRLFEEAAGVTKYKHRRKIAYRKLESVQQDLVRVNDIVKEIQKTVNTLERQAKKAEQYNEISQRLRTIEVDLLERESAYLHGRLAELEEKHGRAISEKGNIDQELAQQDAILDHLRIAINTTEEHLIEVQRQAAVHVDTIHRIEERNLISYERCNALTTAIERYEKEKTTLRIQQDKLQNDLIALSDRGMQLAGKIQIIEQEYQQKKSELEVFEHTLSVKKSALQRTNDEAISLIQAIADKKGEEEKLRSRIQNLKERIERVQGDTTQLTSELNQMGDRVQRMTAEDKELRHGFVEAEMQLYQEESRKKQLKEESDTLQHKAVNLKMEIERKSTRIDFLRGLIEGEEGAKFLLHQHDQWKRRHLRTVADIIDVEEKYRVAIGTALGETAGYLVVEQSADAYGAIEELRKNAKGKATFVVLNRVPQIHRARVKQKFGLPFAADVAQTKTHYRSLINFLLDGVVIAESLEQAKHAAQSATGVRVITLDGQIVSSTGIIRGGSLRHDEGGFIGTKAQIAELEDDIVRLKKGLETVKTEETEKIKVHDALDLNGYRESVKAIEKEMTTLEIGIAQIEFEKKRANEAAARNAAEIEQLTAEQDEIQLMLEDLSQEFINLEQSKVDKDRLVRTTAAEVESIEREWDAKAKMVNDREVELVTLQSEHRTVERECTYTQSSLQENAAALTRRDEEIMQAQEEIARLRTEVHHQEGELATLREKRKSLERQKQDIERQYAQQREEIHRVELKIKDDRRLHDDAVESVHEWELKVSEIRSNVEHLKERAKKEFDLELEVKTYPEDEWVDFAARREDVRQLKEKIRALGAINFAAFDEFKTESERLHFLRQQRDDLLEAERALLDTIEEINNTAQKKFLDTFALIRENFIKTFRSLFDPGDECDVRLGEGVDPLEARIEIIAKPRGKRPKSIELLSGGEKTLTAIALLFAIYLVKPSPFCILDEVDAPLDDSNIDRYTRILHSFSDNTQFIVVTHNKRTMEAANALYGVTMEEEGVSKIVTVRFTEGVKVESAGVASGV